MALKFNPFTSTLDIVGTSGGGGGSGTTVYVELFTLTGTDITNGYVTLSNTPTATSSTMLLVKDAPNQFYGDDFQIVSLNRVSWSGLGLDTILASGDKLTVFYF